MMGGGVRLGCALGAGAAGAGGCEWPRSPAAGPLIVLPARLRREQLRGGRSPASTGNPASPDTCTGRASKWACRVRGRRRLCRRGSQVAFLPGPCGAAAWQASDSRRGRVLGCAQGTTSARHPARRRAEVRRDGVWRLRVADVAYCSRQLTVSSTRLCHAQLRRGHSTRPWHVIDGLRVCAVGQRQLKLFLYQPGTKKVSIVRNKSIRGVQPVAHNTNFDSFLVVKNVLCASSCTPRKQRNTRMDLFRTKIVSMVRNKSSLVQKNSTQCVLSLTMVRNKPTPHKYRPGKIR